VNSRLAFYAESQHLKIKKENANLSEETGEVELAV
jgi:hypothetical protein